MQPDLPQSKQQQWNPLSVDPVAHRFSSYAAFRGTTVIRSLASDLPAGDELTDAHTQLRHQILGQFSLVQARFQHSAKGVIVSVCTQN